MPGCPTSPPHRTGRPAPSRLTRQLCHTTRVVQLVQAPNLPQPVERTRCRRPICTKRTWRRSTKGGRSRELPACSPRWCVLGGVVPVPGVCGPVVGSNRTARTRSRSAEPCSRVRPNARRCRSNVRRVRRSGLSDAKPITPSHPSATARGRGAVPPVPLRPESYPPNRLSFARSGMRRRCSGDLLSWGRFPAPPTQGQTWRSAPR